MEIFNNQGGSDADVESQRIWYRLWLHEGSSQRSVRARGRGTGDEEPEIEPRRSPVEHKVEIKPEKPAAEVETSWKSQVEI